MSEYKIALEDNDSYVCSSTDRVFEGMSGLVVCEECGYRTDFEYINPDFELKNTAKDLSCTWDGYYIASKEIVDLVNEAGIENVEFIEISKSQGFHYMFVRNIVKFDTEKRGCRSSKMCGSCGNYESYVGARPSFLEESLPASLCFSDVRFGSGNSKHPLLFCSEGFMKVLKSAKVKGLRFEQVQI